MTGDRQFRARGIDWDVLFLAIDDHARIAAFTQPHADKKALEAVPFLRVSWPTAPGLASPSSTCWAITARPSFPRTSPEPGPLLASATSSLEPTARRPTAGLNASFSRRCASGPTAGLTSHRPNATRPSPAASSTTTGIALTAASAARPHASASCLRKP